MKNKMLYPIVAVILLLSLGLFSSARNSPKTETAKTGQIDLSEIEFASGYSVPLTGEWYFWPDELVAPVEVYYRLNTYHKTSGEIQFAKVPGSWTKQYTFSNNPDFINYGTMALELKLPKGLNQWAIRLPNADTACSLSINGQKPVKVGTPSTSKETSIPSNKIEIIPFTTSDTSVLLVLQVSNFSSPKTGTWQSPSIGLLSTMNKTRNADSISCALICGALLFMGLYHFCLFLLRQQDKSTIVFAIICVLMSIRNGMMGERIFLGIFPDTYMGWRIGFLVEHLSAHMVLPLFFVFFRYIFPDKIHKSVFLTVLIVSGIWAFMEIFIPPVITHRFLSWFEYFIFAGSLYVIVELIRAAIDRQEGAVIILIGTVLLVATVLNDVLLSSGIIESEYLSTYGMFMFLFAQSFFLSKRFASLFTAVATYAKKLETLNLSLERFIPREMLRLLGRKSITDVKLGDFTEINMTVLFLDIRDFTSRSESMTPSQAFNFINNLLERLGPCIRKNGGFIDKYLGDGFMALFPNDSDAAVAAALAMRQQLSVFNEEMKQRGLLDREVRFGIGIHTGLLMLGTIGEKQRMDPTVISDTVNTASRLEQLTKTLSGDILISAETLESLVKTDFFTATLLGEEKVKGKQHPIKVFAVK